MMNNITFVHGWGLDPTFWQPLITELEIKNPRTINLGYKGSQDIAPSPRPSLYITHSYGTMWALKHHEHFMSGLIAINGFTNFSAFTPEKILKAMRLRLFREPEAQMQDFYKMISYKGQTDNLNQSALIEGLEALSSDNLQEHLDFLDVPCLFLHGKKDPLIPLSKALDQSLGKPSKICEKGGHILPVTHAQWCAQQIKEFV